MAPEEYLIMIQGQHTYGTLWLIRSISVLICLRRYLPNAGTQVVEAYVYVYFNAVLNLAANQAVTVYYECDDHA